MVAESGRSTQSQLSRPVGTGAQVQQAGASCRAFPDLQRCVLFMCHKGEALDTVALECTRLFTLDGIRQPLVSTMTATSVIMELSSPAKRK
ncbi:hypothetical protein E2C01_059729 [Portunus trituberculatus]|uniref:Uncharacterized protein n=1 Tax=Portunus trituberculatus TaxID=210409 RepID=A0A5B7H3E0_PORTR|nr:hypothetical protein [Portunus trituberculatus]